MVECSWGRLGTSCFRNAAKSAEYFGCIAQHLEIAMNSVDNSCFSARKILYTGYAE
jgi:hypothetical protein